MANWWDSMPQATPLDIALTQERIDPQLAQLAQSVYQQESSGGRNTTTSNAGAVGGMQIIPSTFQSVADEGWDINDPVQNARAGVRYLNQMYERGGNDPRMAAIGYYGGPGAIDAARRGQARSDPRNPNAPDTFQYADQVTGRLQPEQIQGNWWETLPLADEQAQAAPPDPPPLPLNQTNIHEQPAQQPTGPSFDPRVAVNDSLKLTPSSPDPMQNTMALGAGLGQGVGQVALGAQHWLGRGLDAIGAEETGQALIQDAAQGRVSLEDQARPYAEAAPFAAGVGRIGGNVAATGPVGKVLGGAVELASQAPRAAQLANALRSGGMNLGGQAATTTAGRAANMGIRSLGGGATGGAMAGLVDPEDAGTGAMIGATFPVAGQVAASGAAALGRALRGGEVVPEVAALASRAKQLGIDVPADRIANSKPLNAVASSLEYVPFSGRTGTLDRMQKQFNKAVSKTFGQDSENVTRALRNASIDLGQKFDDVLQKNAVRVDNRFVDDLVQASARATGELESGQARIITNQIDEILSKIKADQIDGQAAYNIKKTLDRIGKRNTPEAHYADELRKNLMNALNRSLGPREAQSFAKVREQYGNMLALRRHARNGVDGDVSIARIANMSDIRSPELQELADIAAQFLKPREGAHGAAQRAYGAALGGLAGYFGGPVALGGGVAAGRLGTALLNSGTARNAVLRQPSPQNLAIANALRESMPATSRFLPVLAAQ